MSQAEQLVEITTKFLASAPEDISKPILDDVDKFAKAFDPKNAVQSGDELPSFTMTDATGKEVNSAELLAKGPLLLTFYRGEWCPYCNVAVAFLQKALEAFQSRGVTLLAISPELPNNNMTMTEKHELKFPVLTDLHNKFAKQIGIVYDQSVAKGIHKARGIDLNARNGDATWEVPIPATILVDRNGLVRGVWIDPDYKKRTDLEDALGWVDAFAI